ncbi:hypothetical protein [Anabaena sp. CS-542/02]|uniref:hypothetical protein n=1 Tax=Anabaena sp. CS-542/02 TaxID=3021719 RepID=UPI00232FD8F5|nr:hypothetical protein [Anabaena sp. CS-542/02]MDB9447449.1 hypothetical protein [Anabaena sp. CS-542/02]
MKKVSKYLVKIALVCLLMLGNLMIFQPSWAGEKYSSDPDYIEITEALDTALQEEKSQGSTPENQLEIANLKFQKYLLENSENPVGICRNDTEKTLLVYGEKSKKSTSTYDNELYLLPSGVETDDEWDCQGVYIPGQEATESQAATSPQALKIVHGTRLVATTNAETGETEFNIPPAKVIQPGEANWLIPENIQAALDAGLTTARIDD